MTPAAHIQAIEDAAGRYAKACHENPELDARMLEICGASWALLQAAIRAGVGAAPPKDSAEFALAALVAAGHVSQSKVDYARALMPEGGDAPKAAPDFWTVCARHEGGGESWWIPLPGYSNETEHGVKNLVLESARREGYKGTATGRLMELGWEIRPVYLAPPPMQPPEGWQTIETAPKDMDQPVVVRWMDSDGPICHDLDYTEDGCWQKWNDHAEHVHIIGGHGVSYTPPYTHWLPLPSAPKP